MHKKARILTLMYFFCLLVRQVFSTTPETDDVSSLQTADQHKTSLNDEAESTASGCEAEKLCESQDTLEDGAVHKIDCKALVDVLLEKITEALRKQIEEDLFQKVHYGMSFIFREALEDTYNSIDQTTEAEKRALENMDLVGKNIKEAIDGLTYEDFKDVSIESGVGAEMKGKSGKDNGKSDLKLSFDISDDFLQSNEFIEQLRQGFNGAVLKKLTKCAFNAFKHGAMESIVGDLVWSYAEYYSGVLIDSLADNDKKLLPQTLCDNIGSRIQHLKSIKGNTNTLKRARALSNNSVETTSAVKRSKREGSVSLGDSGADESTSNANETENLESSRA